MIKKRRWRDDLCLINCQINLYLQSIAFQIFKKWFNFEIRYFEKVRLFFLVTYVWTKTDVHFRLKLKQMDSVNYWVTGRPKRMDQKDPIKCQWISGSWREASLRTAKLLCFKTESCKPKEKHDSVISLKTDWRKDCINSQWLNGKRVSRVKGKKGKVFNMSSGHL